MAASFDLVSRDGRSISSIAEWAAALNERERTKFVPWYSAFETARAWTEPNRIPAELRAVFELEPLAGFALDRVVVEAKTLFDEYGGPRHHDVLLRARHETDGRVAVIGVESKVNEDFGGTLEAECSAALARGKRGGYVSNMPKRLRGLSVALLDRELAPDQSYDPRDAGLRYQLLSALAGTLVEAAAERADVAMLLVHEYETPISKPGIAERSSSRIQDLLGRFGRDPARPLPLGRSVGPLVVRGGGRIPAGSAFYVAKVRTVVRS